MRPGARYEGGGRCRFVVWAPLRQKMTLKIVSPEERVVAMERDARGYWHAVGEGLPPGARYFYRIEDERDRPDPASCFQPDGVHGASQVVDHGAFIWDDSGWRGIPLADMVMYELHTGAFTPEGTFEAIIPRLGALKDLGINAIEIMPVAQFPGERNWGYDGAFPFAVQSSYGGPEKLKRLVNECHAAGVAVILDVVYNHLGPEGNYLWDFGPYFTDRYKTPWGWSINYDDAYSNDVRNYFTENALQWFGYYHIDALRIDAIHGITDMSAKPFLEELAERAERFSASHGRKFYLIAESDLNDARVIRPRQAGGFGIDAQWNDDFHHCIHTLLTGEKDGYYGDFGTTGDLAKSLREGFVYSGQYSGYRKRNHGSPSKDRPADQFVVFSQNHDQVGNRMLGERLTAVVSFESLKLAAGAVLLSPYIPLLFMGEEYGEDAPFLYFVSHSDQALVEAVRKGRKEEFSTFEWKGEFPDPQGRETFLRSKIDWTKREKGGHAVLLRFYRELIQLRRESPALSHLDKESMEVYETGADNCLFMRRWKKEDQIFVLFHFGEGDAEVEIAPGGGRWRKTFDSADTVWGGPGSLLSESFDGETKTALHVRGRSFGLYRKGGTL
ncbi:MAG: malto-oligosyltrehalose trehalohydrolase [Acidobacteriota bacterium]